MYISSITENEKNEEKCLTINARRATMSCLLACALMLILQIAFVFIAEWFCSLTGYDFDNILNDEIKYLYLNIFLYIFSIGIPFALLTLVFNKLFMLTDSSLIKRIFTKKPLLYITGTLGIGYITNMLVNFLLPDLVERYSTDSSFIPETPYGIFLLFISNAVLPAILEEWAFRGIICKNLLPYGRKGAIIVSSLLFGLMHMDPPRIIYTTVFGIMLAICYEHTGSLLIPMCIHFINNAIATIISVFVDVGDGTDITLGIVISNLFIYVFIGCGIVAIIYYLKCGIAKKKFSLYKPEIVGYKLSVGQFLSTAIFNIGTIPFILVFHYLFSIYFLA